MILQPRDVAILADIGEYGVLDTEMIHCRHWPAGTGIRACQDRLKKLAEAGLLKPDRRVVATVDSSGKLAGGSKSIAFHLTVAGADEVELSNGVRPKRVKRKEVKDVTHLHRLEIVRTRLAIDDAAMAEGLRQPGWIMEEDSVENARPDQPLDRRRILYERFSQNQSAQLTCRPDASCLILIPKPSDPRQCRPLILYWEVDRGTNQLSLEKDKLAGYHVLHQARRYFAHWPATKNQSPIVRVMYVCLSAERQANIMNECRGEEIATIFRFTSMQELVEGNALTDEIWQDVDGNRYAILKSGR